MEDTKVFKNEDEDSVTMLDVLEEEREQENDANAVLGNSDDKECSYNMGYMKRQALYSCVTCNDEKQPAGVCLACSYHCHEGHDLVELYTKRNFRCDCGNDKQSKTTCKLLPKSSPNSRNSYNQNFSGLYCSCKRPYPDDEDTDPDDMIQCIICEDWYHSKHLGEKCPEGSSYEEMTCITCTSKCPFLSVYRRVERLSVFSEDDYTTGRALTANEKELCIKARECKEGVQRVTFWKEGWRKQLCTCEECKSMYRRDGVEFLCDHEDTVTFYERASQVKSNSYDRGMQALSSMDRIQQVEVAHEYNHLKSELMDYLKEFASNKRVVREEDIKEFFTGMNARKKPRYEVPDTCR